MLFYSTDVVPILMLYMHPMPWSSSWSSNHSFSLVFVSVWLYHASDHQCPCGCGVLTCTCIFAFSLLWSWPSSACSFFFFFLLLLFHMKKNPLFDGIFGIERCKKLEWILKIYTWKVEGTSSQMKRDESIPF